MRFGVRSEANFKFTASFQHALAISLHGRSVNNRSWRGDISKILPNKSLSKSFARRADVKILRVHGGGCRRRRHGCDKSCIKAGTIFDFVWKRLERHGVEGSISFPRRTKQNGDRRSPVNTVKPAASDDRSTAFTTKSTKVRVWP